MIGSYVYNVEDISFDQENELFINNRIQTRVKLNFRNKMDGIELLSTLPPELARIAFFDPQYRGILDKMKYGNEKTGKGKRRASLQQMDELTIINFIQQINRALKPSGYLFLWVDKFHLCEGFKHWLNNTDFQIVDLIVWDKEKFGLGYRTRKQSEYCVVIQKKPILAKKTWTNHSIPDVWGEKIVKNGDDHPHLKPSGLIEQLIMATTSEGDYVLDPAAGSYRVMNECIKMNRIFIGGDIEYGENI